MAQFRVQVNYLRGTTGKWSNVWHVEAADITAAELAFRTEGVPDLLPMLDNSCLLHSLLTSDPLTAEFITTAIDTNGTSSATGDLLPLFNAARVFFLDGSLGRQDNKYFKGFVTESIQAGGLLLSGTVSAVEGLMATLISDMDAAGVPLVSVQGDPYASAVCQLAVQMRQMHRKRKHTTP
jgi:hypothetical protein